jgi:hypothetical protein
MHSLRRCLAAGLLALTLAFGSWPGGLLDGLYVEGATYSDPANSAGGGGG